jgi:hypothetical protein
MFKNVQKRSRRSRPSLTGVYRMRHSAPLRSIFGAKAKCAKQSHGFLQSAAVGDLPGNRYFAG